jgi:phytanoyl-CoA hydroxylase
VARVGAPLYGVSSATQLLMPMLLPGAATLDLAPALAHYAEHGWARIGKVATEEVLALLRARADAIMLGEVRYPGLFFQIDAATGDYGDLTYGKGYEGPSLAYRKVEKLEKDPLYRAWLENPLFGRIARAVIGEHGIALYRAVLFAKGAQGGSFLPFHQDAGVFWGLDRDPCLQIWTALDDVPVESGAVEVVDGSHARGLATPLGGVVPEGLVEAYDADASAMALPAEAGEVLLIHNHLWHRSGQNRTGRPRRAFTACYIDARTRCQRKRRAPREFVKLFVDPASSG